MARRPPLRRLRSASRPNRRPAVARFLGACRRTLRRAASREPKAIVAHTSSRVMIASPGRGASVSEASLAIVRALAFEGGRRLHDPEHRPSAYVFEGKVHAMRERID